MPRKIKFCILYSVCIFILHSFGLGHDGEGNSCEGGKYVMSSVLPSGMDAMRLSKCSKEEFQGLLRYYHPLTNIVTAI